MIRVIVNGAQGNMGSLACETLENHPDFNLVASVSRQDNLVQAIRSTHAEIVVDLTRADCAYTNALTIINEDVHPVIGTSGLTASQIEELSQRCEAQKLGAIIAPNFSIGAILMMQFAAQAARYLSDVEIIESHHRQKLDAPSGTALKTAEMIAKARKSLPQQPALKELISGVRGGCYQDINIHSLRLPGILARQEVIYGNVGETLTIKHDSIDRRCFMPGIIFACQEVPKLDHLVYGLEALLSVS